MGQNRKIWKSKFTAMKERKALDKKFFEYLANDLAFEKSLILRQASVIGVMLILIKLREYYAEEIALWFKTIIT